MLTIGAANATIPYADLGAPAIYGGSVYYAGQTTPGIQGLNPSLSLRKYDPSNSTTTIVAPLPVSGPTAHRFSFSTAVNGVLYINYYDSVKGRELFGYNGGNSFIPITDVDGPSVGFDPTSLISYNGDLLIAGTTSANGTELYRLTGNGLGLTDAQNISSASLSPNPTSSELTVALPTSTQHTLRVVSATGQTLRMHTVQGPSATVAVQDLPAGIYFVHITDATGAPGGTARFVKE